jgi:hypothetical protein
MSTCGRDIGAVHSVHSAGVVPERVEAPVPQGDGGLDGTSEPALSRGAGP